MRRRAVLLLTVMALALGAVASPASATTFTVNSTDDAGDANLGDGVCQTVTAGECTLRAAIQAANANENAPTVDLIHFNIAGDGPHVIAPPTDGLPTITEPVTIDGYTQGDLTTTTTTDDARENTLAVGTNADLRIEIRGTSADPGSAGLTIGSSRTTVRGLVITGFQEASIGFGGDGIAFDFTVDSGTGNRIEGNFIGTNRTGTTAQSNEGAGVFASLSSASKTTIGGTTPASRNLISANDEGGIRLIRSDQNIVRGNLIGTRANGTDPLGNGFVGISVLGDDNLVTENVVAFNANAGVRISDEDTAVGNRILTNSIHSNGGPGIDLGDDGQNFNDPRDPDTGPNNLQNFPAITSATSTGTATTIKGTLNSKPRKTFTIQFFSNPVLADEGKTYQGQANVKTNRRGKASFTFSGPAVDTGQQITATATGADGTSEFSNSVAVGAAQ